MDGNWSTIKFQIGEPKQDVNVLVSTALSEFWVVGTGGCVSSMLHVSRPLDRESQRHGIGALTDGRRSHLLEASWRSLQFRIVEQIVNIGHLGAVIGVAGL